MGPAQSLRQNPKHIVHMNASQMALGAFLLVLGLVFLIFGSGIVHGFLSLQSGQSYTEPWLALMVSLFGLIFAPVGAALLAYGTASS